MRRQKITRLVVFTLLLFIPAAALGEEKETEKVQVRGVDRMWGDTEGEKAFLEGDLVITKGDTVLYAPFAEVEKTGEDSRIARLTGGVRLVDDDVRVNGEEMQFDLDNKRGVVTGNARLEREETRDEKGEVKKERIVLTCSVLEIDTDRKDFTASGDVLFEHEDFTVESQKLTYDDDGEILFFTGGFFLSREKEVVTGERLRVDLKEETFEAWGRVELVFEVEEEKEEESRARGEEREEGQEEQTGEEQEEGASVETEEKQEEGEFAEIEGRQEEGQLRARATEKEEEQVEQEQQEKPPEEHEEGREGE